MDAKHIVFTVIFLASGTALGRFDPEDAKMVDAEEKNNTESWNDKNSYRYPKRWDDQWSRADMGYRVNAGSLNVSRFNYEDDIRLAPRPLDEFTASYTQSRREDLAEQTIDREVRVGWRFIEGMRFSILGDVNTFKEFGDLGVALAVWEAPSERTEIYYWSVDHYYDSKRSDDAAHRDKNSQTIGLQTTRLTETGRIGWAARYEYDSPVEWSHPAAGWQYAYERNWFDGRIDVPISSNYTAYGSLTAERKIEKKVSLISGAAGRVFKFMERQSAIAEVGMDVRSGEGIQYTAAVQTVRRRVGYDYGSLAEGVAGWSETNGPKSVHRDEWGLILTRHRSITPRFAFQHGASVNDVRIKEDNRIWKTIEVKYQALFDFTLNENTFMGINTTWDIDQIIRDYPYPEKAPFRPWGGGALLFMMRH